MSSESRRQASLLLNVMLAMAIAALALHKFGHRPAPSSIEAGRQPTRNKANSPEAPTEKPLVTPQSAMPQYADFASASDRRRWIVDRLRAMNVPNDVLALVAREDLEVQWDSRFQECGADPAKMAAMQLENDTNKDAEMRAALGEKGFKLWDQKTMLWEAMSTEVEVTPSEAEAIYQLKKKLQQRQFDLTEAGLKGSMADAEINAAYKEAYSDYNRELKAVLGEERYAKSQQNDDAFVRGNLEYSITNAGMSLSDSQLQQVFAAEQQWNRSLANLDPSSPDYANQMNAMNEARDQEYQRVLGTNALETLQKQQDTGYSSMKKYENLWGLDDDKIDYVYGAVQQYQKSVADYKAQVLALQNQGQGVDWDAVNTNLQQLANQTQQTLQSYLGQDSFNKLLRNHVCKFVLVRPPQ